MANILPLRSESKLGRENKAGGMELSECFGKMRSESRLTEAAADKLFSV